MPETWLGGGGGGGTVVPSELPAVVPADAPAPAPVDGSGASTFNQSVAMAEVLNEI